jgi:adenylyl cyclase-associated protein
VSVLPNGNPLTSLLHRLEAATSRLEDIAQSADPLPNGGPTAAIASKAPASASAPELPTISPQTSTQTVRAAPEPVADPLPASIQDMDALINAQVADFVASSKGIDGLVEQQVATVAKGFADQRRFLLITTRAKKPDPTSQTFMDLLKDLQQDLGIVGDIKDSNRGSPMKDHLSMVAEGISTLQWLVMPDGSGKPADMVGEVIGGAQMYGNRVLKAYKEGCVLDEEIIPGDIRLTRCTEIRYTSRSYAHTTPFSQLCRPTLRNTTLHG